MRKKEIAASLLARSGALRLMPGAQPRSLRILAYHRVLDDDPRTFAFDEALISTTRARFRRQMSWVGRHFNVVSFAELARCEEQGRPWPERALIITFDDGYRDNYVLAFPILKELGLTAAMFLSTGHIGEAKLFWWDLIAWCLKRSPRPSATLPDVSPEPLPLGTPAQKRAAIEAVLRWIKTVPEAEKAQFLAGLSAQLDVDVPPDVARGMHLSWDEVREMSAGGIEFGSHTVTHPILANVTQAQLQAEIRDSKATLEQQINRPVIALTYPVGGTPHFNESVRQTVEACGFRYAGAAREAVATPDSDRFALPRIHVDYDQSFDLFRASLLLPGVMLR